MLNPRRFSSALLAGLSAPALIPGLARSQDAGGIAGAAGALDQLHAILVQKGDEVVVAEARRGPGLDRAANIKSCSKSILALLLGASVSWGELAASDTLGQLVPELIPADATEGVAETRLSDLVTLRLGLQGTSGPNYGAWVASRNWVSYALRQPRIGPAGGRMIYSSGTTHVLGAALARVTGESLLSLARSRLGAPLGIEIAPWTRDPQGYYFGGNEMALSPRAMLRIAVMMRDGGRYEGTEVISPDWMRLSTGAATRSPYSGLDYGYGWFLSASGWIIARGYGGQIIAAHPGRALAVAITSDPNQPARSDGHFGALMDLLEGPVLSLA